MKLLNIKCTSLFFAFLLFGALVLSINPASADDDPSHSGSSSQFSLSLLGSYGMSKWDTNVDINADNRGLTVVALDKEQGTLKKLGIGFGVRYQFPNSSIFMTNRFFYHPKGRTDRLTFTNETILSTPCMGNVCSPPPPIILTHDDQLEIFEKWKNQMLLGWNFLDSNGVKLNLLAGITLARINTRVYLELLIINVPPILVEKSEIQVAPTVGFESEVPLKVSKTRQVYWVFGTTFAFMSSSDVNTGVRIFTVDSNLQWDIHTGFRIPF